MLGLILSVVGLGGAGAALAFIPGALPFALTTLRGLWSAFRQNPGAFLVGLLIVALVAALASCVWLWRGWDAEKAGRHSDAVAFQTLSDQNRTAQIAVNHAPAVSSAAIARKSDAQAPVYYRAFAAAAAAHAERLPSAPGVGTTGLPGADPPGPGIHGPAGGTDPGMVCRPRADDSFLVRSTARLAQVLEDVKALIAVGDAVPADDPTSAPIETESP